MKTNNLVKELGFTDFDEITKSDKPYVVKFTNPTCHLCKALKPIYAKIADSYSDKFNFGNVNTRVERKLTKLFAIDGVPELFIISEDSVYNIPYPEDDPDPSSGYSEEYIIEHLEGFLNENT